MKLALANQTILNACGNLYDKSELAAISRRILEHLSEKSNLQMLLDKELEIDTRSLFQIIESLNNNEPIQYILGYEWFAELKIKVNRQVLIPRPETEELTRKLFDFIKQKGNQSCHILDIGTGSGCIPILLKKELPTASVYAIDISEKALEIARENAIKHHTSIHFIQADILDETIDLGLQFDFIISNPPYILQEEKKEMHFRVLAYEPELALFVTKEDPLEFYKAILFFAKKFLKKKGQVFVEINSLYANAIQTLFETCDFKCEILEDMYGNKRFAIGSF